MDTVKRLVDFGCSAIALLILSPVLAILAILVRLSSPGPTLFRQERVGLTGSRFTLYKFRSMRTTAEGPAVTSGDDRRITPIGRILRRWKLDELLQLFNVLRGEMSLVGPRPEVLRYVEHYTPEQREVLTVRPGITGLSQIEFRDEEKLLADQLDPEAYYLSEILPKKLAIDLHYVRTRTFWGDILILARTIVAILPSRSRSTAPQT